MNCERKTENVVAQQSSAYHSRTAGGDTTPMSYKYSSVLTDMMAEGLPCPPCSLRGHLRGFPAVPRTCCRGRSGPQEQRGAGRGGDTHRDHGACLGCGRGAQAGSVYSSVPVTPGRPLGAADPSTQSALRPAPCAGTQGPHAQLLLTKHLPRVTFQSKQRKEVFPVQRHLSGRSFGPTVSFEGSELQRCS